MALDFATLKDLFNKCDPRSPLEPTDDRNLDIDALGAADERVRGEEWARQMAKEVLFSTEKLCLFFTGLRGSGKSTELKRFTNIIQHRATGNYFPVYIDAEEVIDLGNAIDIPDLLISIVYAAEKAVLALEGRDPETAYQDSYAARLWNWLQQMNVELKDVKLGVKGVGEIALGMRHQESFRDKVRLAVSGSLSRFLDEVRNELTLLNDRVRRRGKDGLLVVFDSLEKLTGMSFNWDVVMVSAERVFGQGAPYLRLPVHVIYTVPPAIFNRTRCPVRFFPMIKVRDKQGVPYDKGLQAARELVRKRIPDEHLTAMLGPEVEERMKGILLESGGYPRDIVRILRAMLLQDDFPLSEKALRRVLNENAESYRKLLTRDAFPWLVQVVKNKDSLPENDEHLKIADRMLTNNVVLKYQNAEEWYDLHPAVKDMPELKRLLEQGGALGEGGDS